MKNYIEITLRPDAEVGLGFLWQKVYQQIHLALVEVKDENDEVSIGVSFPRYCTDAFPLGDTIRLFAKTADELTILRLDEWLSHLLDYADVSDIKDVPSGIETHASFSRKQIKSNIERLVRRQAKRKEISFEEALKNYADMQEQTTQLPYVTINSLSSGQRLKLFIQKESKPEYVEGRFSTYGLSKEATVPWF